MEDSNSEMEKPVKQIDGAEAVTSFNYLTGGPGWGGKVEVFCAIQGEAARVQMIGTESGGQRWEFVNAEVPIDIAKLVVSRQWEPLSDTLVEGLRTCLCAEDPNWPEDPEDGVDVMGVQSAEADVAIYVWGGSPHFLSIAVKQGEGWRELTADDDGQCMYKDQTGVPKAA